MRSKWKVRYLAEGEMTEAEIVGTLPEVAKACDNLETRAIVWHGPADSDTKDIARGTDSVSVEKN